MTEREITLAMAALIVSMFVAQLSNLVVLTAMPRIAADLHATQAHYTWIITASMLTLAISTPIWGRVSDVVDPKRLMQLCVGSYVGFSLCASLAPSPLAIIACRVAIGICAAGIIVLLQTISAAIMSPRRRAEWIGIRAAALAVSTICAPTVGGLVTERFGWRACFLIGLPFAIVSIVLLQRTLHLAPRQPGRRAPIDWPGAILLSAGIVAVLVWISVVGPNLGYVSPRGLALVGGGIALLGLTALVERRVAQPILPFELFRNRDIMLCVVASTCAGVGMFGSAVFLAPYLQLGRGLPPATAGLMYLPEAFGSLAAALATARVVSRHGRYKPSLVTGALLLCAGFALLSTIRDDTPLMRVGLFVMLVGAGLGVTGETLTIVVQNAARAGIAGAAGALVNFFRMLGGIAGVAVLGAVLSARVRAAIAAAGVAGIDPRTIPQIGHLAPPARMVVQGAYAQAVSFVYLCCVPLGLVMLAAMLLLRAGSLSDDDPFAG